MVDRRWLMRLGPPLVGALSVGAIASASLGVTDRAWDPLPCSGGAAALAGSLAAPPPATPAEVARGPWFTLDPVVDEAGTLVGQRLRIGPGADRATYLDLPPESSAAGPFGRLVLVTRDDGRRSELRAFDRGADCWWALGHTNDVVRRATIEPSVGAIHEHRVDRATRADLGVWRRPLDGSPAVRELAPLPRDGSVGVTFSTTLSWSLEGDRLAVQSCGAVRCRTQVLDAATGAVRQLAARDQGELIGLAGDRVVAYAACAGLPCPLVAIDVDTGVAEPIAPAGGLARLIGTRDGPRLAVEAGIGGGRLEVRDLAGRLDRAVRLADPGLRLMPGADRAAAGVVAPPGWLVLAPDGRSPERAVLTRLADGWTVELQEVLR